MKNSKKATSIVEAIIVMLIITAWITWVYNILVQYQKLSDSTKHKINAIEIAKEWIESMKNIRNTNWLLYSIDTANCWNTLNYNNSCLWDSSLTNDIWSWSYIIYSIIKCTII